MKIIFKYLILIVATLSVTTASCSDSKDEFMPGSAVKPDGGDGGDGEDPDTEYGFDFSKLTATNHPRLLMSASDFEDLKTKVTGNSNLKLKELHEMIIRICDKAIMTDNSVLEYKLDASGTRILDVSRKALSRISFTSYAYRMTGEAKYLQKAEADLNTVCNFQSWNPSHFLDVAEMTTAVSIGYDWLYDALSETTKEKIVTKIKDYAFKPSNVTPTPWYFSATNNWNQVCNGGLVFGAISIYEHTPEEAKAVIERAASTNKTAMEQMYSPDGNYTEGPGYWGYGTGFEVLMLAAMEKALGSDAELSKTQGFKETAEYCLFATGIGKKWFNYADCQSAAMPAYAMWWFANKYNNPSLLYNEMKMVEDGTYEKASDERRLLPTIMAFANSLSLDNLAAPQKKIWSGNGEAPIVIVRTDWTQSETDKYLGIKGGMAGSSHGHMDSGSFIYDALGERWAMDFGLQSYTTLENALKALGGNLFDMTQNSWRWKVFRLRNSSHNTITVNDAQHLVGGNVPVTTVINSSEELGATLDLTPAISNQVAEATRTIKIVNNKDLIIIDRIKAMNGKDAKIRWNMVTDATPEELTGRIKLSKNGKTMYLRTSSTETFKFKILDAIGEYEFDQSNGSAKMAGFEATVPAGKTVTFTTTLSPDA